MHPAADQPQREPGWRADTLPRRACRQAVGTGRAAAPRATGSGRQRRTVDLTVPLRRRGAILVPGERHVAAVARCSALGLVIIGGTVAGGLAACRAAVCPGDGFVLPFVEILW